MLTLDFVVKKYCSGKILCFDLSGSESTMNFQIRGLGIYKAYNPILKAQKLIRVYKIEIGILQKHYILTVSLKIVSCAIFKSHLNLPLLVAAASLFLFTPSLLLSHFTYYIHFLFLFSFEVF